MSEEERLKWVDYLTLEHTPTYGLYKDRVQEYEQVYGTLFVDLGIQENDFILDIGAGSADLDRYMRESTQLGSFKYMPIDGSTVGRNFNAPNFWTWLEDAIPAADYIVSIETIEHLYDPRYLFNYIEHTAKKGAVITTPNGSSGFDVIAADSTHYSSLTETTFLRNGYEVRQHDFCGRSQVPGQKDALIAWKKFQK